MRYINNLILKCCRRKKLMYIFRRNRIPSDPNASREVVVHQSKFWLQPRVWHALVVIFLEFFSWGLLINLGVKVLSETFKDNAFLINGFIQGVKGLLSFLSAPLVGALSDLWGRKHFLLLTVTFTCAPIPLMRISPMWYFAMQSLSGVFSVTFSIIFAYVADITDNEERSRAYGLVSATFAASLIVSPYIGHVIERTYNDSVLVAVATSIAVLDVLFILVFVPESLNTRARNVATTQVTENSEAVVELVERVPLRISWEKADPFGSLCRIGHDRLILMLSVVVLLSYLPEAGEYSVFFVYLKLVIKFNEEKVAIFVAIIGVLSCIAQTLFLAWLMRKFDKRTTVIVGLIFETLQCFLFGLFWQHWILFIAGAAAAIGSITYPAISVFVSEHASLDQQGVAQGVVTGIRGLCNGIGPAMFGFVFYLFDVNLHESGPPSVPEKWPLPTHLANIKNHSAYTPSEKFSIPGPPFAFGGFLVIIAMIVALFMPTNAPNNRDNQIQQTIDTAIVNVELVPVEGGTDESGSEYNPAEALIT